MAAAPEDIPIDPAAMIRIGTVASVDLAAARCTVRYGDPDGENSVSPPMRWLAVRAGRTGLWSPPSVDEQGIILSPEGDIAGAIFLPGIVYDEFPPVGSSLVELIEFADGAVIAYDAESHILTAELPAGSTANIQADQITITGNVAIDGDLTVSGLVTAENDVVGGGKSLKDHKHTGVQAGGGVSGSPQ